MAVYIAGYGIGRFWVEGMRIDDADEFAGLRVNQWVAALAAVLAIAYIVWVGRQGGITRRDPSPTHPSVEAHPSVEGPEAGPSTLG
jgi:prolipoprotein diacylglyceryltransferase